MSFDQHLSVVKKELKKATVEMKQARTKMNKMKRPPKKEVQSANLMIESLERMQDTVDAFNKINSGMKHHA